MGVFFPPVADLHGERMDSEGSLDAFLPHYKTVLWNPPKREFLASIPALVEFAFDVSLDQ